MYLSATLRPAFERFWRTCHSSALGALTERCRRFGAESRQSGALSSEQSDVTLPDEALQRANLNASAVTTELVFPGRVEPGMMLGSYEVLLSVARGGMACVWAARQHGARGFNRLVALKTVLPELAEPEFESMFLDEARLAARIHHPNVCEIFELVEHDGVLALSMEWIDGETLNTILSSREHEVLDTRVAAHVVAQVACGLHAAHELRDEHGVAMQLVHRDVSPQNILISRTGHVKVSDFGVAKALGDMREDTAIGRVKGKLSYMSPEQAEGYPLDRRSDVFALGVVLYLATVGLHPFRRSGETREQQLMRLLVGRFKRPSAIIAGYPAELEAVILRAMSRDPGARYGSADEMRCRLQEWLNESGPLVTEQHVARAVQDRVGYSIQRRAERIQRCIRASRRGERLDATPTGAGEITFVPTMDGVVGSVPTLAMVRPRQTLRLVASGFAIALFAVLGTLAIVGSRGSTAPRATAAELVNAAGGLSDARSRSDRDAAPRGPAEPARDAPPIGPSTAPPAAAHGALALPPPPPARERPDRHPRRRRTSARRLVAAPLETARAPASDPGVRTSRLPRRTVAAPLGPPKDGTARQALRASAH
jgi:serine/threonine protein kinase